MGSVIFLKIGLRHFVSISKFKIEIEWVKNSFDIFYQWRIPIPRIAWSARSSLKVACSIRSSS